MNKSIESRGLSKTSKENHLQKAERFSSTSKKNTNSDERVNRLLDEADKTLNEGLSSAAEKLVKDALKNSQLSLENTAKLRSVLSYIFETQGNYEKSLEVIKEYENNENVKDLSAATNISILTTLAIAYSNTSDYPKAVTLLNRALVKAKELNLENQLGQINVALSRVYRKLNEFPISRDYAEKGLKYFREVGNWRGMAESYQTIAGGFHQEGNSEKSLEFYELAVKIIGDRSAPFLLGKIYSDMSGAFWFLRRPQEGVECLEKSIKFFEKTEHKVQSIAAYNNLGINLILIGNWAQAETVIKRALEIALEVKHVHIAGILDSLGELKFLRGDYAEARKLLEQAIKVSEERKKEWYTIQAKRNLARCLLAEGQVSLARQKASEAIFLCKKIGEKQIANMSHLVLAECYLEENLLEECESELKEIEESNPVTDFFVLGNIQKIRGLKCLKAGEKEMAQFHLRRSLTIFETVGDVYNTALLSFILAETIIKSDQKTAKDLLLNAVDLFQRLGVAEYVNKSKTLLDSIKQFSAATRETSHTNANLLTQRLAESVASRELLFRELIAILNQESGAKRLLLAEINEENKLIPLISEGFLTTESAQILEKIGSNISGKNSRLERFSEKNNICIFHLKPRKAQPAYLIVYPRSGSVLNDGNSIQPILSVAELGMDVCALRDRDNTNYSEADSISYSTQSIIPGFIHSSPAMTSLVEEIYKIRSSDVTVLVTGESGTGKELVSRAIHAISNRKDKIFVPFNCTAVPKELAESYLFGYRKGAYTGAVTDSPGLISAADGGTLFLDEIGDLPLDVQPKLLRFLQDGEIQPIGEKKPFKVDVRIIAATNMPLEDKVADGLFREDLYYRLNVIRLRVPPLRERRSEIPPIVNYYLKHYSEKFGRKNITISPQAVDLLMVCDWAGNVRELCNEIQRIVARAADGETITPEHLSADLNRIARPIINPNAAGAEDNFYFDKFAGSGFAGLTIEEAVSELEIQMINNSLAKHQWNISRVARDLGLTRRGLYLKLSRYGIEKSI